MLGCFHMLASVNHTAMNTHMQTSSGHELSFLELLELLGHGGTLL